MITADHGQEYALNTRVIHQGIAPYVLNTRAIAAYVFPYRSDGVTVTHRQPYTIRIIAMGTGSYALTVTLMGQRTLPYSSSERRWGQELQTYRLLNADPAQAHHRQHWDLASTQDLAATLYEHSVRVTGAAGQIVPARLELHASEVDYGWSGTMWLARIADYQKLRIDELITVKLDGERFSLMVDEINLERRHAELPRAMVKLISPTASLDAPRAIPITRAWLSPVLARAAVESILGQTVAWEISDWLIPGGRLSVNQVTPMRAARGIVASAGAIIQSLADGSLKVRHRFPTPLAQLYNVTPDHIYTDRADNLSLSEISRSGVFFDAVTVRSQPELPGDSLVPIDIREAGLSADLTRSVAGSLTVRIDPRESGLNAGNTRPKAGSGIYLLVHKGRGAVLTQARGSAGLLRRVASQRYQETIDLIFKEDSVARAAYPLQSIDDVTWLGADLGALILDPDQRTVYAAMSGTAIARIQVNVAAHAYHLSAPLTLGGDSEFFVQTLFQAEQRQVASGVNLLIVRGVGDNHAPDIVDPLVSTPQVALERARALLDAHSGAHSIRQWAVFRSGVSTGQIAETHDALAGAAWRAQVSAISHIAEGVRLTTELELLRPEQ